MAGALFTVLAVLAAIGVLTGFDRHAVAHWMPGLDHWPRVRVPGVLGPASFTEALLPGWSRPHHANEGASLATYVVAVAASGLPSALVVGGALLALVRRGRRALALLLAVAFVAGNIAEVISKLSLERDPFTTWVATGGAPRVLPFDHSYPSGHALRAMLMALCVLAVWRRAGQVLIVWALAVAALLVSGAWHTPTDVIGGTLLAICAAATAAALAPWLAAAGPPWLRER